MVKERVEHYYSEFGWRMFDPSLLTPELKEYLSEECRALQAVVQSSDRHYDTLIEVGCGYGRYLEWALERQLRYEGIDLVPWLVEMGQGFVAEIRLSKPEAHCEIRRMSAQYMHQVLSDADTLAPLIFFPFNCFGSLADPQLVLESLSQCKGDLFISTFQCHEQATAARKDYYEKCGASVCKVETTEQGRIIESEDGLVSIAYSEKHILESLASHGFVVCNAIPLTEIGIGYFCQKLYR